MGDSFDELGKAEDGRRPAASCDGDLRRGRG